MTAIFACFERTGTAIHPETIQDVLSANVENAIDGSDVYLDKNIALAAQYLWVTPEEHGERQPVWNQHNSIAILGNMRIDNRQELGHLLALDAQTLQETSDTRLVLEAYQHWGTQCVSRLLGDFAFAIWEPYSQSLFMARDPLGVKNLCFLQNPSCFAVASEMEHLLAFCGGITEINQVKLAEYLADFYYDQQESFFEGIQYLPPAHALRVTRQETKQWCYWKVDPELSLQYPSDEAYAEHFKDLLGKCVNDRLRSVGPVGISMSGGLDSSSVAALASQIIPESPSNPGYLHSYSYAFEHLKSCDERAYITHLVEAFPLVAKYVFCDDEWTLRDLSTWPIYREYPTNDPYPRLPQRVMQAAQADGIKLLLTGYFGDVLFIGQSYWLADMIRFGKIDLIKKSFSHVRGIRSQANLFFRSGLIPLLPRSWKNIYRKWQKSPELTAYPFLQPDFVKRTHLHEQINKDRGWKEYDAPGQWDRLRRMTLNVFSQGAATTDKTYHQHGMEITTPYWDRRLIEFVMAIPAYQLGRPGMDRFVFRNAMRGTLPEPVRTRKQRTIFNELFTLGLLEKEKATVQRLIKDPLIVQLNLIKHNWLIAEFEAGSHWTAEGYYFWKALSLELWLRKVYNVPLAD